MVVPDLNSKIRFIIVMYRRCLFFLLVIGWGIAECCSQDLSNSNQKTEPPATNSNRATKTGDPSIVMDDEPVKPVAGLTYSEPVLARWKVGTQIKAGSTDAMNIIIAVPVPRDWPEQQVVVDNEDMPPSVGNVTYGELKGGIRRQLIKIPFLKANETVEITTTFRVLTSQINAPSNTTPFQRPKTTHKEAKDYLTSSPQIEFSHSKFRIQLKSIVADKSTVWEEIEAIYDWVRENIDQKEMPNSGSIKTFLKGEGSEEDRIGLFVAFCRCHKIPARIVWVDGGSYAEFMLVDAEDKPYWFPCNVVGIREFGSISEPRIILQKGDNIKVPEKEERQRFVTEHMTCQGTSRPVVRFVRELLPGEN